MKAPQGRALRVSLGTCCRMTHHRIAVRALAGRPELAGEYTTLAEYLEKVARPERTRLYAEARAAALAGDTRATTLAVARLLSHSDAFGFYGPKLSADPAFAGFTRSPEFQRMGPSERCCEVREPGIGDDGAPYVRVTRYREGQPESTRFEPPP